MHLLVTGLSHKTAPVEIREKMCFSEKEVPEALEDLLAEPHVSEACILSTCNRVELYTVTTEARSGRDDIVDFLSRYHEIPRDQLEPYLYFHEAVHAVHHLFKVTSSLDSMVLGESQILGQVKDAYAAAYEADATSLILNKLFRQAFSAGKIVRTETSIGESAVSISYAAVELAKKVFESIMGKSVLVLGAGEMSELTAKHLVSNGVESVFVANRTEERAQELAEKFGGQAVNYDDLENNLARADIVISSTGAPHFVLKRDTVQRAMALRSNMPLFLIDIAVPRDIDPEVGNIYNVYLYNIDDLENVVESNLVERKKESRKAEAIVAELVEEFLEWLQTIEVVPTITALREHAEHIRQKELRSALGKLGTLGDRELNALNAMTSAIVNKLLHDPIVRMKKSALDKDGYLYVDSVRYLFNLEEEQEDEISGHQTRTTGETAPSALNLKPKPHI